MADLAVLQTDQRAFARLRSALRGEHSMRRYEEWTSLAQALEVNGFHGCIVDLDHPSNSLALGDVVELRKAYPLLAIVVCADFRDRQLDLFHLGQIGVDSVILAGGEVDPTAVRHAVVSGLASAVSAYVARDLAGRVPGLAIDCLTIAIEHADESFRVRDLAREMSLRPDALNRDLRAAGLPSANRFLIWGKLFRASRLLGFRRATVETVAYAVGYSSAAALTRALKRFAGCTPASLMDPSGLSVLTAAFVSVGLGRRPVPHPRWSPRPRRLGRTLSAYTYH